MQQFQKLVKAGVAGGALGVSAQTIYRRFTDGSLPGFRLGKAVRFDVDELRAIMREAAKNK